MAGLVPAIHVLVTAAKNVDARCKAGHDELMGQCLVVQERGWPGQARP